MEWKAAVSTGLRRRAVADWTAYADDHAWDGAGWYAGVPVPGEGAFRREPTAGANEMAVRAMTGLRLHGHFLQSRLGALRGAGRVLTGERRCPLCAAGCESAGQGPGMGPVEDEPHFLALCPGLAEARAGMLAELEGAFPGFRGRYDGLSAAKQAEALLFTVPDGRWPSVGGAAERARRTARGVRAVAAFVLDAAAVHPVVGRALWTAGR